MTLILHNTPLDAALKIAAIIALLIFAGATIFHTVYSWWVWKMDAEEEERRGDRRRKRREREPWKEDE
jgi:hypothetical protein